MEQGESPRSDNESFSLVMESSFESGQISAPKRHDTKAARSHCVLRMSFHSRAAVEKPLFSLHSAAASVHPSVTPAELCSVGHQDAFMKDLSPLQAENRKNTSADARVVQSAESVARLLVMAFHKEITFEMKSVAGRLW